MSIKMIVTDLDCTLLLADKSISDYTAYVLNRCREHGIKVVFATARYLKQVKDFTKKTAVDAVIAINGAIVYMNDEIIIEHTIHENTKHRILHELDTAGVKIAAEKTNIIYTNRHVPDNEKIAWDFTNEIPVAIHKISIRNDDPELIMFITKKYDDLCIYPNSGDTLFDINSVEASKWKGIIILSKLFDISLTDIAAFGDDFNDIEMLKNLYYFFQLIILRSSAPTVSI
jgi:Cof subfamily protein (haloacid dehalogenase superfamily)